MADRGSTRTSTSSSKRAGAKVSPGPRGVDSHPTRVPVPAKHFLSDKVGQFTESVIREMTRQAMLHGAVNLAQGFPDFSAPAEIKQAAQQAVAADVNQYAITWGAKKLRDAIARQMGVWQGITLDP
jgi:DNA-binding transcriptional MocR family regulator